jgi:hypothetical protein
MKTTISKVMGWRQRESVKTLSRFIQLYFDCVFER